MQCNKCGQDNMDGAQLCQRCGTNLGKAVRQPSGPPMWFGSRVTGVFVLIAGVLVIVGIFLPWLKASMNFGELFGTLSISASGWDLMTGSGDVQDGVKTYAILAFAGSIVLLLGAVWAFLDPEMRFAWAMTIVGGVLATVGSVWGWQDLSDFVSAGVNTPEASIGYGAGLYLALAGGIAGVIAGIMGRLGASEQRIRL
jgi:hypothetical protein